MATKSIKLHYMPLQQFIHHTATKCKILAWWKKYKCTKNV